MEEKGFYDDEVVLLRNLVNRIIRNERNGLYSLRGDITGSEMQALRDALNTFKYYNLGELIQKAVKS